MNLWAIRLLAVVLLGVSSAGCDQTSSDPGSDGTSLDVLWNGPADGTINRGISILRPEEFLPVWNDLTDDQFPGVSGVSNIVSIGIALNSACDELKTVKLDFRDEAMTIELSTVRHDETKPCPAGEVVWAIIVSSDSEVEAASVVLDGEMFST